VLHRDFILSTSQLDYENPLQIPSTKVRLINLYSQSTPLFACHKINTVKLQKRLAGINIFYRLQMWGLLENHQIKPVRLEGIIRKRVLLEGEPY
jgi:hypothetical protein